MPLFRYKKTNKKSTNNNVPKYRSCNAYSLQKKQKEAEERIRKEKKEKETKFINKYINLIMKNIDKAYNNCNKRASEGKDNTLIYRINVRVCYKDDFKWLDSYIYRLNGRNKYPINIEHSHRYVRHDDTRYIHAIYFRW
mgnify:CR=1 FL=1